MIGYLTEKILDGEKPNRSPDLCGSLLRSIFYPILLLPLHLCRSIFHSI